MATVPELRRAGQGRESLAVPDPRQHAMRILAWTICWPWNLLWTLFVYNPFRYVVEFVLQEFHSALEEISCGQFRDVEHELQDTGPVPDITPAPSLHPPEPLHPPASALSPGFDAAADGSTASRHTAAGHHAAAAHRSTVGTENRPATGTLSAATGPIVSAHAASATTDELTATSLPLPVQAATAVPERNITTAGAGSETDVEPETRDETGVWTPPGPLRGYRIGPGAAASQAATRRVTTDRETAIAVSPTPLHSAMVRKTETEPHAAQPRRSSMQPLSNSDPWHEQRTAKHQQPPERADRLPPPLN